jgi:hypothetical protein
MSSHPAASRQRGVTTLTIAILLLAILTVITLFATNVTMFETRTSANEFRADRALQAAQRGLALGVEYFQANRGNIVRAGGQGWFVENARWWEPCSLAPTAFPCNTEPNASIRNSLYRFCGRNCSANPNYTVALPQPAALDGDEFSRYRVGALLCRIQETPAGPSCSTDTSVNLQEFAVRVISLGGVLTTADQTVLPDSVAGQGASDGRAMVAQTIATYRLFSDGPEAPIIAANDVTLRGTFDIVANPNAGGFGIPISIWSRTAVDPNGTPTTCHVGEYLATGTVDTSTFSTWICPDCDCPSGAGRSLTYKHNSCPGAGNICKGIDIIDATGNDLVFGQINFPADLFLYMTGTPRTNWERVKDRVTILDGSAGGTQEQPRRCADLGEQSTGMFWSTEARCTLSGRVGTPETPVFVIAEREIRFNQVQLFGVIYSVSIPTATCVPDNPPPNGCPQYPLTMQGRSQIYGALVADSNLDNAAGRATVIYRADILANLSDMPTNLRLSSLPGSWTDLGEF